jgi:hypothetical protein
MHTRVEEIGIARTRLEHHLSRGERERRGHADRLRVRDAERQSGAMPRHVLRRNGELARVRDHERAFHVQLCDEEGHIEDPAPAYLRICVAGDGELVRQEVAHDGAFMRVAVIVHPSLDEWHVEDGADELLRSSPGARHVRYGRIFRDAPLVDRACDEEDRNLQDEDEQTGADSAHQH